MGGIGYMYVSTTNLCLHLHLRLRLRLHLAKALLAVCILTLSSAVCAAVIRYPENQTAALHIAKSIPKMSNKKNRNPNLNFNRIYLVRI